MKPLEIKEFRLGKKLTQAQLAKLYGMRKITISRWEAGIDRPSGAASKLLE
ncbi:MAG: helix-turn-helix domain-containing protein [Luteolibacter sp.]